MTVRNVKKNLAAQQDMLPGVGPYNQIRRGATVVLDGPAKSYIELWRRMLLEAGLHYAGTFEDGCTVAVNSIAVSLKNGLAYSWNGASQTVLQKDSSPETTGGITPETWKLISNTTVYQKIKDELSQPNGYLLVGGVAPADAVSSLTATVTDEYALSGHGYVAASYIGKLLAAGASPTFSCFGDSTMWGATVGNLGVQSAQNPPASFAQALNLVYGRSFTVANRAISGSTLRGMMTGTDGSGSTFEAKISAGGVDQNTTVIICNHGINDSQLDLDIQQYKKDLEEFVRLCRTKGKVPILATPNPNPQYASAIIDEVKGKRLMSYVRTMRSVAMQTGCDLVDQYELFLASTSVLRIEQIVPDGAHLSHDGYRQAGYNLAIPFVQAHTIGEVGSQCGLENTTYFDNATVGRQLSYSGARTGATFSCQKGVTLQGINYPVIFDRGLSTFSVMCLEYSDAAKLFININSTSAGTIYPAKEQGSDGALDWDSERKVAKACFAGLNILSVLLDPANYGGAGISLTFAGLRIPSKSTASVVGRSAGTYYAKEYVCVGDTLSVNALFINGSSVKLVDRSGALVAEVIKNTTTVTANVYKNGSVIATKTIGTNITDSYYDVVFTVGDSNLTIDFGALAVSISTVKPLVNTRLYTANTRFTLITG